MLFLLIALATHLVSCEYQLNQNNESTYISYLNNNNNNNICR